MFSSRITSIKLVNFIGIKTGLNKDELKVDFSDIQDKDIILILGDNGTGKSTFMSALHCLPETTDGRDKFIIKDKEGLKVVKYERNDGARFTCKIVYTPTKTGHSTKCFIEKKTVDGNCIELNANGNVRSYIEVCSSELGISKQVLKLSNQNDTCKGFVDMTVTDRKVNMSAFLPDDIYSAPFAIADKAYKELKVRTGIIVDTLGKLGTIDELQSEKKTITNKINGWIEKRDKCNSKIAEYKTRIAVIKESGVEDRAKELNSSMKSDIKESDLLNDSIDKIFSNTNIGKIVQKDSTAKRIEHILDEFSEKAKGYEINAAIETANLATLRTNRNSISNQIAEKEALLSDLETSGSLDQLKSLLTLYEKRVESISSLIKGVDTSISKETYINGYNIIAYIRSCIEDFGNYSVELVNNICDDSYNHINIDEKKFIKDSVLENKSSLMGKLGTIEDSSDSDILDKRPINCHIDNCPFINDGLKLKILQSKIPDIRRQIEDCDKQIVNLDKMISDETDALNIIDKINNLLKYIEANRSTISKLPNNNQYSSYSAILKSIKCRGSNLSGCDDFEENISAIELYEEKVLLETTKIPSTKNEIAIIETKGSFILNNKNDILRLKKEKMDVESAIETHQKALNTYNESIEYSKTIIESLSSFREKKEKYETLYSQILSEDKELSNITDKLDEIKDYKDKIVELQTRLAEIEDELTPLTRKRELIQTDLIKRAEFEDELKVVNSETDICSIIRESVSAKGKGIPVMSLQVFLDQVRQSANVLLSKSFDGDLYMDEFIIDEDQFSMPYRRRCEYSTDVSYASSSEKSFISLCLTMAIIEEISNKYGIVCLDEIDRGFSNITKQRFISIITEAISRAGINQLFMITHNPDYYRGYEHVAYIIFPGGEIDSISDDAIYVERE